MLTIVRMLRAALLASAAAGVVGGTLMMLPPLDTADGLLAAPMLLLQPLLFIIVLWGILLGFVPALVFGSALTALGRRTLLALHPFAWIATGGMCGVGVIHMEFQARDSLWLPLWAVGAVAGAVGAQVFRRASNVRHVRISTPA